MSLSILDARISWNLIIGILIEAAKREFRTVGYFTWYIAIRSGILSRLDRSSVELDVRRAFTSVQLRTILEENHHSFLIVEHNPLLYERARDMTGHVAQAMLPGLSWSSSFTPLYWTGTLKQRPELAGRVFSFYDMQGQACSQSRGISEELASQTTRRCLGI